MTPGLLDSVPAPGKWFSLVLVFSGFLLLLAVALSALVIAGIQSGMWSLQNDGSTAKHEGAIAISGAVRMDHQDVVRDSRQAFLFGSATRAATLVRAEQMVSVSVSDAAASLSLMNVTAGVAVTTATEMQVALPLVALVGAPVMADPRLITTFQAYSDPAACAAALQLLVPGTFAFVPALNAPGSRAGFTAASVLSALGPGALYSLDTALDGEDLPGVKTIDPAQILALTVCALQGLL